MITSFMLAEKYVPKDELLQVCKAVLRFQEVREQSWDGRKYAKTDAYVAKIVVKEFALQKHWVHILFRWNVDYWNDVQDFAMNMLEELKK